VGLPIAGLQKPIDRVWWEAGKTIPVLKIGQVTSSCCRTGAFDFST
jgi:hypothetical protein